MRIYVSSCVFPGSFCLCRSRGTQCVFTRKLTHQLPSPFLKKNKDQEKLSRRQKRNTLKKQVGVKRGVGKEEERLWYSWCQGSAPSRPTIYCGLVRPELAADTHAGRAASLNQGCPSRPSHFPLPSLPQLLQDSRPGTRLSLALPLLSPVSSMEARLSRCSPRAESLVLSSWFMSQHHRLKQG